MTTIICFDVFNGDEQKQKEFSQKLSRTSDKIIRDKEGNILEYRR